MIAEQQHTALAGKVHVWLLVKHKEADICVLYMYRTMSRIVCL